MDDTQIKQLRDELLGIGDTGGAAICQIALGDNGEEIKGLPAFAENFWLEDARDWCARLAVVNDTEVAAAIPQFPEHCRAHPHGVRVERDRFGVMAYCGPCVAERGHEARLGAGATEPEAVAAWNEVSR